MTPAAGVPARCPFLQPSPRAKAGGPVRCVCRLEGRSERVAAIYQAQVCAVPAFLKCKRLEAAAEARRERRGDTGEERQGPARVAAAPAWTGPDAGPSAAERAGEREKPAGPGAASAARELPGLRDPWAVLRPQAAAPRSRPVAADAGPRARPITLGAAAMLALAVTIVFAAATVGLALVYRATVGPGMGAGPQAIAENAAAGPTLRPTFTPAAPSAGSPAPPPAPSAAPTDTPAAPPTAAAAPRPPAGGPPTRLVIPGLDLDIPVLPVGVKTVWSNGRTRTVWDDVPNAGGFHRTSAYPGHAGNIVINGHRDIQGSVFRHLDRMRPGDDVVLYVGDVPYAYRVSETLVVPETFASAAQRTENMRLIGYYPEERLTLVTCTPVGLATHRLLVIALPADPQMPEAGSTAVP